MRLFRIIIGSTLLGMLGVVAACEALKTVPRPSARDVTLVKQLIPRAWEGYRQAFVQPDGRVVRPLNQGDTVSEGQAYAMLLAVLLDDRATFRLVWEWTDRSLSRRPRFNDHLLAWHWERESGVTSWNSAADADVDYALALILADWKWNEPRAREQAIRVLADILRLETAVVAGKRYLLPGNWRLGGDRPHGAAEEGDLPSARQSPSVPYVLNPSYFSPAHFRVFHRVTGDPRWLELVESSYHVLDALSREFGGTSGVGLVPDWVAIAPDGRLLPAEGFSAQVSWDAIRVPWRIGLDYFWFGDDRAAQYLRHVASFFAKEWEQRAHRFFVEYTFNGQPIKHYESPAAYAMSLPAFKATRSALLPEILAKVASTFRPAEGVFYDPQDYYQNSLTLLGLVLMDQAHSPAP